MYNNSSRLNDKGTPPPPQFKPAYGPVKSNGIYRNTSDLQVAIGTFFPRMMYMSNRRTLKLMPPAHGITYISYYHIVGNRESVTDARNGG